MSLVTCRHCGRNFDVRPARLAAGRGVYCSRQCMAAHRAQETVEAHCAYCGRPFPSARPRRRFCSRSCAGRSAHAAGFVTRTCKVCGRPFTPASMQDSCCSLSCEAAYARASGRGALFDDPWASGAIPPDRYDRDFYRIPDTVLGF